MGSLLFLYVKNELKSVYLTNDIAHRRFSSGVHLNSFITLHNRDNYCSITVGSSLLSPRNSLAPPFLISHIQNQFWMQSQQVLVEQVMQNEPPQVVIDEADVVETLECFP